MDFLSSLVRYLDDSLFELLLRPRPGLDVVAKRPPLPILGAKARQHAIYCKKYMLLTDQLIPLR